MPKKTPEGTPPHVISGRHIREINEQIERARQEWDMVPASDPIVMGDDQGTYRELYVRMKYKDE